MTSKDYMMATIDDIDVYLHEAVWVLNSGKPIPSNKLVLHKDGNTMNNSYDNLELIDEFDTTPSTRHKLFHENNYKDYKYYIESNFRDIFEKLFQG